MSQAPSMPFFVDAYLADTGHLTAEEHGAYMLLLMTMWRRGGVITDDDKDNARVTRLSAAKWKKVKPRIMPFLTKTDGGVAIKKNDYIIRHRMNISNCVRQQVLRRDEHQCVYCHNDIGPFHLDHVIPWSRGGSDDVENLVTSCVSCNLAKGAKLPEEWIQ